MSCCVRCWVQEVPGVQSMPRESDHWRLQAGKAARSGSEGRQGTSPKSQREEVKTGVMPDRSCGSTGWDLVPPIRAALIGSSDAPGFGPVSIRQRAGSGTQDVGFIAIRRADLGVFIDPLRNETPVYMQICAPPQVSFSRIFTGAEPVGEGENRPG